MKGAVNSSSATPFSCAPRIVFQEADHDLVADLRAKEEAALVACVERGDARPNAVHRIAGPHGISAENHAAVVTRRRRRLQIELRAQQRHAALVE